MHTTENVVEFSKPSRRRYPREAHLAPMVPLIVNALDRTGNYIDCPASVDWHRVALIGPFQLHEAALPACGGAFPHRLVSVSVAGPSKTESKLSLRIVQTGQGKYLDGTVDVITWKRGEWEGELIRVLRGHLND